MSLGSVLILLLTVGAVGFVLWTMPIGQRLATSLGLRGFHKEGATREDREFLLRVCNDDPAKVEILLDRVRAGRSDLSDAQVYRAAIRAYMRDKHGGNVA